MEAKLIKTKKGFGLVSADKTQAIASTINPHDSLKLSLKNCQVIKLGYDLDELAKEYFKSTNENAVLWRHIDFKAGFQKALEIIGDNKFSEDNMIKCFNASMDDGWVRADFYIQSLQQTEWDVEIEMEDVFVHSPSLSPNQKSQWEKKPLLDADGCLILKRK